MPLQDLAFAGRTLRKSSIFALTAALTIALGVGASTAIFSVTNAVLLRPLPYKDPDRLVIACSDLRNRNVRDFPFSNANFIDLREGTKNVFQDLAGVFTDRNVLQREDGTPEQIRLAVVTTNFFRLVGAKMALGRDFTDADGIPQPPPVPAGAQPAAPPPRVPTLAILSYEYFQRRYSGNPAVLGQVMFSNGPFTPQIVGVLAPQFHLYFPPEANEEAAPDVWLANRLGYDAANRNGVSIRAVGRLKEDVSLEQAQATADTVAAEGRKDFLIRAHAAASCLRGPASHLGAYGRCDFSFTHRLRQCCQSSVGARLFAGTRTRRARGNRRNMVASRPPDASRGISACRYGRGGGPRTCMAWHSRIGGYRPSEPSASRYHSNRLCRTGVHGRRWSVSRRDFRHGLRLARLAAGRHECASGQ